MTDRNHRPPTPAAERRHLTVMFCDIVDSTGHAERLDPEDWAELQDELLGLCVEQVERFGGTVARCIGDALLIYFGFPHAHEDDARRCVAAALAMVAAVERLSVTRQMQRGTDLAVRIGIHTGLAVVGEMGPGAPRDALASIGEAPNMAARLQQQASPGVILISAATHDLVRGYFHCKALGSRQLKGFSTPVELCEVIGEAPPRGRIEVEARAGLTPVVGRLDELDRLRRCFEQAAAGKGQAVLVRGEPGIGKSRLLEAFKSGLYDRWPGAWEMFGSDLHRHSPWYPVVEMLGDRLQMLAPPGPASASGSLVELCSPHLDEDSIRILTRALYPTKVSPPDPPSEHQRFLTIQSVVGLLRSLASKEPLVLVIEDLQWIDSATLELIGHLVECIADTRICLLASCRPDFRAPWPPVPALTELVLSRLSPDDVRDMVKHLVGSECLALGAADQVVRQSDGIPLFVEELTRALLRDETSTKPLRSAGEVQPAPVPPTLRDLLVARLDRTGPARTLAQIAATLGRTFSLELLAAVTDLDPAELEHRLHYLVLDDILQPVGGPPSVLYRFRHALIQQAAYESLLKRSRSGHHRRIARTLVEDFPTMAQRHPELVAHHFTEAREPGEALPWWQRAARLALEQSANLEAAAHLRKGLELLGQLPEGRSRGRLELEMRLALGVSLTATEGAGADAVERTYLRAQELCAELGEREQLFPVLWGLWRVQQAQARLPAACRLSDRLGALAAERRDRFLELEARHAAWTTALLRGEPGVAAVQTTRGLELYRAQTPDGHALIYGGHDTAVCARILGAWARWLLGEPDTARRMADGALSRAREMGHPASLVHALHWGMPMYQFLGDAVAVVDAAREMMDLSKQPGLVSDQYRDRTRMLLGWGLNRQGREQEGLDLFRRGLNARPAHDRHMRPYFHAVLAEMLLCRGDRGEALELIARALEILAETRECWWEPELRRLSGEAIGTADPQQARQQMELALKQARAQGARSLELRAARSLMRLSVSLGHCPAEAGVRLRTLYDGFTEGFETTDLGDVRSLLDSVSQGQSPS